MFFYLAVWFQRERFEALLAVNIMKLFSFHGARREGHQAEIGGIAMMVGSWSEVELATCFVT
jgi:hypothetical protein